MRQILRRSLPYGVTRYYRNLAKSTDPESDPIAAQFVPQDAEMLRLPYESTDPLGDELYRKGKRVLHHYRDRILILANDRCATYCRHCFRRHFVGNDAGRITEAEIDEAAGYLSAHQEVHEALISGGDPLMLPDEYLILLVDRLRDAREDLIIRIGTRIPVVQPARVTVSLAIALGSRAPIWVVIHANHPNELTDEFRLSIARLVDNGVPVVNQSVLLRGVNDSADTLEALFRGLLKARVKPYYLFQGDLASGTRHFRTSIDTGLALMRELRRRLSGMAIPTYAVDLPGGNGKLRLTEATVVGREADWYLLRDDEGREHRYPREE